MKTSDLDDIHDLRVASRQFRAALELFDPFASKEQKRELRKNVRRLTRILGGLRNIDEALLFFRSPPRTDIPASKELCRILSKLRSRNLKLIKKALSAFDHRKLDRMVRELVAGLNEDCIAGRNGISSPAYLSGVSIRRYLPICQLLAVATAPAHRASRHALRIAIKKWRYFLEIVSSILDRDYTPVLETLKGYQSILGRMNDIAEFEVLLSNLDVSPEVREYTEATLQMEDALLLNNLTGLIERKPLAYTFLI